MVDALSRRWGSSKACAEASETSAPTGSHTGGDGAATGGSSEDTAIADFASSGTAGGVKHAAWGRVHDDATRVAGVLTHSRTDSCATGTDSRTKTGFVFRRKVSCPFRFRLRAAKWLARACSRIQRQLLRVQGTCNSEKTSY
jgi:hypothetical protein